VPPFALRLVLGELARYVLAGKRVVPARALREGFTFEFPSLDRALADLYPRPER
jgi:NAD dependent epimerase/dehydratase family enzyme